MRKTRSHLALATATIAMALLFGGAIASAALASRDVVTSGFDSAPLARSEAQALLDYELPQFGSVLTDAVVRGTYIVLPAVGRTEQMAGERPSRRIPDRHRPFAIHYSTPRGDFVVSLSRLSWNAPGVPTEGTSPYGLDQVTGTKETRDGHEVVIQRDTSFRFPGQDQATAGVTYVTREFALAWRGEGTVLKAFLTISGALPEDELVRIILSAR